MTTPNRASVPGFGRDMVMLAVLLALHTWSFDDVRRATFERAPRALRWATYYAIVLVILRFGILEPRTFIYAQF